MSGKSQEVYEFIVRYHRARNCSPSVREIASGVGLRSPASVQRYIDILTEDGMLTHVKGQMRTLMPSARL